MDAARYIALVDDLRRPEGERPWVEFKVNNYDPDRIGRTISAISNAARLYDKSHGYIIWGIEDISHEVVGTTFDPVTFRPGNQNIELWLSNKLSPSINFTLSSVLYPTGARVVIAEIFAAQTIPTKFGNIAYIRIGDATPKLADYPEREAELIRKLQPFAWEGGIASTYLTEADVLSCLDYQAYFSLLKTPAPTDNVEIITRLKQEKLITDDFGRRWKITNLGALLFARDIARFDSMRRKAIRIVKYNGSNKTAEASEISGDSGYAVFFSRLFHHIHNNVPKNEQLKDAIIRELVTNALIHQDMTIVGSGPMVDIYNDRIEITNPGIPLIDPERFLDALPQSRNEGLAALMRRFGMCEERGSGVRKAVSMIELYQLPPPAFSVHGNITRAVLFAPRKFRDMDSSERARACYQHAVLQHLSDQKMTNKSLRKRFGISDKNASQVSGVINLALQEKLIRQSEGWTPRSGHYLPWWA
jgi:ATP-dependent DNA helicase RecG